MFVLCIWCENLLKYFVFFFLCVNVVESCASYVKLGTKQRKEEKKTENICVYMLIWPHFIVCDYFRIHWAKHSQDSFCSRVRNAVLFFLSVWNNLWIIVFGLFAIVCRLFYFKMYECKVVRICEHLKRKW